MANNEQQFKTELLKDFSASHVYCHAFSVSDRFHSGRPDIYVKHPEFPGTWLELKFTRLTKDQATKYGVRLLLSPAQRKFLESQIKAGGAAGWVLCVKMGNQWALYAGCDPWVERALKDDYVCSRHIGGHWPVMNIMGRIMERLNEWKQGGEIRERG